MEEILLKKGKSLQYEGEGQALILQAMISDKKGVSPTILGLLMKSCHQDVAVQSALLLVLPSVVMLAHARTLILPVMEVVIEDTHDKEDRDHLLLLHHLILQAMMPVHKKLAPLHHPTRGEDIDVRIRLGKDHAAFKSSKKEERISLFFPLMEHMVTRIRCFTLFTNLLQLLVERTSRSLPSSAMFLCICKSLLASGGQASRLKASNQKLGSLVGLK